MAEIGDRFHILNQLFWYVCDRDGISSDGRTIKLSVWRSNCADCGAEFDQQMVAWFPYKSSVALNRRCDGCKKPGVRVGPQISKKPRVKKGRRNTVPPIRPIGFIDKKQKQDAANREDAIAIIQAVAENPPSDEGWYILDLRMAVERAARGMSAPDQVTRYLWMEDDSVKATKAYMRLLRQMKDRGMIASTRGRSSRWFVNRDN